MTEPIPPTHPLGYSSLPPGESGISRLISWIVIIACVALLSGMNWAESRKLAGPAASVRVDLATEIAGKYLVGAQSLASHAGQGEAFIPSFLKQLDDAARTPIAKLATIVVVGEWQGKQAALDRLDKLQPSLGAELKHAAEELRIVYSRGPQELSPRQQIELHERLGWLGKLAESFGKPDADPQRVAVLSAATHTCFTFAVVVIAAPIALITGLVLLLILLVRLNDGKLRRYYLPTPAGGGVFLEAFAVYLAGFIVASLAAPHLPAILSKSLTAHISLLILPTILAILWPIVRGAPTHFWRYAMGWHTGRGTFREIGMGVVGYLAGLPILAVGLGITFVLIKASGATPSHPIEKMLGGPLQMTLLVFFLASVYAPITEETMFRGAFFHSLRTRHGWFISALVSSFIFAAIHPQGWTVVPTLMAIAIVFAGIREWRGTILSSATAHCLHNSVLVTVAIQMMK